MSNPIRTAHTPAAQALVPSPEPLRSRGSLSLCPDVTLVHGRAHEICGGARRTLALWLATKTEGPVLWISPSWQSVDLHAEGVWHHFDPGRLIFLRVQRAEDLLWSVEEALRSGAVPLVVADLPGPPALTPVRRLHLAAEQGGDLLGKRGTAPTALLLTPDQGGAPGVESRWQMLPRHLPQPDPRVQPGAPSGIEAAPVDRWKLNRLRARSQPPASWHVTPNPCSEYAPDAAENRKNTPPFVETMQKSDGFCGTVAATLTLSKIPQ